MNKEKLSDKSLSRVLWTLRQEAHLSLTELAEEICYSKGYLSRVENGKVKPSIQLVERYLTTNNRITGRTRRTNEIFSDEQLRGTTRSNKIPSDRSEIEEISIISELKSADLANLLVSATHTIWLLDYWFDRIFHVIDNIGPQMSHTTPIRVLIADPRIVGNSAEIRAKARGFPERYAQNQLATNIERLKCYKNIYNLDIELRVFNISLPFSFCRFDNIGLIGFYTLTRWAKDSPHIKLTLENGLDPTSLGKHILNEVEEIWGRHSTDYPL
jgi:transcriptional regulator with XRE-family HTH domain